VINTSPFEVDFAGTSSVFHVVKGLLFNRDKLAYQIGSVYSDKNDRSLKALNLDIVTGLFHQKGGGNLPNIYKYKCYNEETGWHDYNNIVVWEKDTLVEIDGCGFGCVLIKTDVFRNIKDRPWFDTQGSGEDFYFCRKAIEAGYKIYCDTSIKCSHLTVVPINTDHFYARKLSAQVREETENQIDLVAEDITEIARNAKEVGLEVPT